MLVDAHAHFLSAATADHGPHIRVRGNGGHLVSARTERPVPDSLWNLDARLAELERSTVDIQVISPPAAVVSYAWTAPPNYARTVNEGIASACAASKGRLIGLACLSAVAMDAELARCRQAGMRGVAIGTTLGGLDLDAEELRGLWDAAASYDASVFVHPVAYGRGVLRRSVDWIDIGLGMPTDAALAMCALVFGGLLAERPALRVAVANGGGTFPWAYPRLRHASDPDRTDDQLDQLVRRVFVDTTMMDHRRIALLAETFGPTRILYGSDAPFFTADHDLLMNDAPAIHEPGLRGRNALDFLGIP